MMHLSCCIFIIFTPFVCLADEGPIDLQLEVFQALREGVEGVDFKNEPVRIGLPFPRGVLKEVDGRPALAVAGSDFQCRTLKRWEDGSVQWGLIEFFASAKQGKTEKVNVVQGTGISSDAMLAVDKGNIISVDTGPLQVVIDKRRFNLFDHVIVDGKEVIQPGTSRGIVLKDGQGVEFLASSCKDTKAIIEDNGPVSASIKVDGGHCSEEGKLLDYTVRLFFTKGKSRVKIQYTMRNASENYVKHAFIKSLSLETALNLEGEKKATVSTFKGDQALDLGKGDIRYYQAVSDFPWLSDGDSFYWHGPVKPDYKREKKRGYSQEGNWLWHADNLLLEGGRNQFPDLGYLNVSDSTGLGMTAGVRYLAGQWPKTLKASRDGGIEVALWPEENNEGYWIRFGSHNTFEILFDFHANRSDSPEEVMNRFQYPLKARAEIDWYNNNVTGIYPLYHFISFNDEKKLSDDLDIKNNVWWRRPRFKVWRYHYWGHGAFINQHDFARIALVNFLRDDRSLVKAGQSYLQAESIFNYYADWAVYHSDDYDYASKQYKDPEENNKKARLPKVNFEWEHQHWYGMPLYYYMTGDERIKDAVIDLGEYLKKIASKMHMSHMRVVGCSLFSLAAMYEFTGQEEYLNLADRYFDKLLNAKYNEKNPWSTIFIDWEKGYVAGGSGSGWSEKYHGIKADLMLGSILYDGLLNYYFFKQNDSYKEKAHKLLLNISDFMLENAYFEGTKGKKERWAFWIPYVLYLKDREKSKHSYKLIGQASFWPLLPYTSTGEEKWVVHMEKMMKMALFDDGAIWAGYSYIDHPGFQTIGFLLKKKFEAEKQ